MTFVGRASCPRTRRRLGSLAVLGLGLVLGWASPSAAQLSPGPLSSAHAELEGASHCLDCHAPRRGVAPERCLDCHVALRQRVAANRGLHAQTGFQTCESCHIEHHGRDFELIFWDGIQSGGSDAFDHIRAGWRLEGAHANAACGDCHRPANLIDPARLRAGAANPETTFLGLSTTCTSCHEDPHRGQFASASAGKPARTCTDCHGTTAWKPVAGFDHARTDFPLRGAHAQVACADCHASEAEPAFLQFRGVSHAACTDCHTDPHRGRLGATCESCHSVDDWRRVDRSDFDHSRTRFPLTGLHGRVSCTQCHGDSIGSGRSLRFASCADCHRDPHDGQLGSSCASCHDTRGWREGAMGSFGAGDFDHDRTRFALRGEHRDLACVSCHRSGRPVLDALAFGACEDCHADPHRGQLRDAVGGGACADCHGVEGFVPARFGLDDHSRSDFPLTGAHQAVACVDCHVLTEPEALAGTLGRSADLAFQRSRGRRGPTRASDELLVPIGTGPTRRFDFVDTACEACHHDPHGFSRAGGPMASLDLSCSTCHSTDSFVGLAGSAGSTLQDRLAAAGFDHGQATGFALEGAHATTACTSCHGTSDGAPRFEPVASACSDCHADPHFGTTRPAVSGEKGRTVRLAKLEVACTDCHAATSFRPARFDHARDAGFALEGAHEQLACATCHRVPRDAVRLPDLPTTCEGCHGVASTITNPRTAPDSRSSRARISPFISTSSRRP